MRIVTLLSACLIACAIGPEMAAWDYRPPVALAVVMALASLVAGFLDAFDFVARGRSLRSKP